MHHIGRQKHDTQPDPSAVHRLTKVTFALLTAQPRHGSVSYIKTQYMDFLQVVDFIVLTYHVALENGIQVNFFHEGFQKPRVNVLQIDF